MGALPMAWSRSCIASLARQHLLSRFIVILTCAVCSLLSASCLFSSAHSPSPPPPPPPTFVLFLWSFMSLVFLFALSSGFGQCY